MIGTLVIGEGLTVISDPLTHLLSLTTKEHWRKGPGR